MDRLDMSLDEIAAKKREENRKAAPRPAAAKASGAGPTRRTGRGKAMRAAPFAQPPMLLAAQKPKGVAGVTCHTCGGVGHVMRDCPSGPRMGGAAAMAVAGGGCYGCGGNHVKAECPHRDKMCDNCGERGHLRIKCRKEPVCFGCGSLDHDKAMCPHKNKTCDICGKVGHLRITCRQAAPPSAPARRSGNTGDLGAFGEIICDNCLKRGHKKRDCPDPTRCLRCGSTEHKSSDCGQRDKTCDKCGKVGHLKAMCHL